MDNTLNGNAPQTPRQDGRATPPVPPAQFPAVLIISRPGTRATPEPQVFKDDRVLHSHLEARARIDLYRNWEVANRTRATYTYTLAALDQADAVKADTLARLQAETAQEAIQ